MTDYQHGYLDGLKDYAWVRDGQQYVGAGDSTLSAARARFLARKVDGDKTGLLKAALHALAALEKPDELDPQDAIDALAAAIGKSQAKA